MVVLKRKLWLMLILLLPSFTLLAEQLAVSRFAEASLEGWKEKVYGKATEYEFIELDGRRVLSADSQDSASGYIREIKVDLKKYPYLNWSWATETRLQIADEKTKPGDDYVARVYVVADGGLLLWRTRAVNYVWAGQAAHQETWSSAYTGDSMAMMALRNRKDELSTWYQEKRNVYEDFKRLHGKEYRYIDAVIFMTDTDNSHGRAKSYYGEIFFSSD